MKFDDYERVHAGVEQVFCDNLIESIVLKAI